LLADSINRRNLNHSNFPISFADIEDYLKVVEDAIQGSDNEISRRVAALRGKERLVGETLKLLKKFDSTMT